MPNYEVEHTTPLTPQQQDALAEAITKIHTEKFSAPSLFVNVRFTDIFKHAVYVAGKRRNTNRIFAYVRHGPSRTRADNDDLCQQINSAWDSIVNTKAVINGTSQANDAPRDLRAIFVLGCIVGGMEVGFPIPEPGSDAQWMRENLQAFKAKGEDGDEEFAEMVEEVERRGLM